MKRPWPPQRARSLHAALSVLALTALVLLAAGCVEVRREVPIEVTPGETPEEIQGARWQSLPVAYCVVESDAGFVDTGRLEELVAEAFERWGVDTTSDGRCDEAVEGNGRNEITWGEPAEPAAGSGPGVHQAGFTRQLFRSCVGDCEGGAVYQIVESDIILSPEPPDPFHNEECLFSTILHETGHFLGVPHLPSPAVMAPVTSECRQDLTDADLAGLAELYGAPAGGEVE